MPRCFVTRKGESGRGIVNLKYGADESCGEIEEAAKVFSETNQKPPPELATRYDKLSRAVIANAISSKASPICEAEVFTRRSFTGGQICIT